MASSWWSYFYVFFFGTWLRFRLTSRMCIEDNLMSLRIWMYCFFLVELQKWLGRVRERWLKLLEVFFFSSFIEKKTTKFHICLNWISYVNNVHINKFFSNWWKFPFFWCCLSSTDASGIEKEISSLQSEVMFLTFSLFSLHTNSHILYMFLSCTNMTGEKAPSRDQKNC